MDSFEDYIEQNTAGNDDELLAAAMSNTYEYLINTYVQFNYIVSSTYVQNIL